MKKSALLLVVMLVVTMCFCLAACDEDNVLVQHVCSFGEWTVTEPTCEADGAKTRKCERCGAEETVVLQKSGHTEVIDAAKTATCTETGLTEGKHCSVCNKVLVAQKEIAKLGHSYGEWIIVSELTCTTDGEKKRVCQTCGYEDKQIEKAVGHKISEEWTIDKEATPGSDGQKSRHCKNCDYITDIIVIRMHAHSFADDFTCHDRECTVENCGYIEPATTDHTYGSWIEELAATCIDKGTKKRSCENCGFTEEEDINALGHDFSEEWTIDVAATCEHVGSKSHHCSRCSEKSDVTEIEKADHTYGEWTVKTAAICTTDRVESRTCSVCGEEETNIIENSALGHDFSEEWTIDVAATCEHVGSKSHHCSRCSEKSDVTEIEKADHTYGEWTVKTAATCTTDRVESRTCSVCGKEETNTVENSALGHDKVTHEAKAATCTENGWEEYETCTRCDYTTYTVIPATGHDYNADGVCNKCGQVKDTEEPDTGRITYEYDASSDSYVVVTVDDLYLANHGIGSMNGMLDIPNNYNDGYHGVKPVRAIRDGAFRNNEKITMLIIAANVEEIGVGTFENCKNLMFVSFFNNSKVQVLSERVFAGCGQLTDVYFGQNNSLTTIKTDAFNGCGKLAAIELSSVTKIEDDAFCGCSINKVYVEAEEEWNNIEISESEKSVFRNAQIYFYSENAPEERGFFWKWGKEPFNLNVSEWRWPSLWDKYYPYGYTTYYYIEKTSSYGLSRVYNLTGTEYSISETYDGSYGNLTVTEISSNAFYNSSSVSSIIIPTSVVSIKSVAFSGLTNVTITYLGTKAKWEYEVKKAIGWKIGCEINSIIHCSDGDFLMEEEVTIDVEDCPIITSDTGICYAYYAPLDGYVVTGLNGWDYSVIIDGSNGCLYLPEKFDDGTHGEKAVVAIKEWAFASNRNIRRVIIPASVKCIGYRAFYNCNSLYYVVFADDSKLITLSESAFEGCKTLAGVLFGKGSKLQKIKSNAFAGCLILQIFLPKTLKGIAADAFGDDAAIDIVFYEGTQADWQNVIMSDEYRQKFAKTEFAYYLADQSSEEKGLFWAIEGTTTIGDSVISNGTLLSERLPKGYIKYDHGSLILRLYFLEEGTGGKYLPELELYYEMAKGYIAFIQIGELGEGKLSDSYVIPEKRDGWCGELSVTALSADFSAATESISLTVPVTIKYISMEFGKNGATVTYLGTMSQWRAIEKQIHIGSSVTIHCSDGDIEI